MRRKQSLAGLKKLPKERRNFNIEQQESKLKKRKP
jgi:hypothetical protein